MKILNLALIAGAAYLLFSSFKGKETPVTPTDPVLDDPILDETGTNTTTAGIVTASSYSNPTHPLYNQVPLFVKRFYEKRHLPVSPFSAANGTLPAFSSAYTNMQNGIEVHVYEEADYQPGRKICRITNFTQEPLTDEMITRFLQYPVKYTNLYWGNKGIAVPLREMPKSTPYNMNIWVLRENLRAVPAAINSL